MNLINLFLNLFLNLFFKIQNKNNYIHLFTDI